MCTPGLDTSVPVSPIEGRFSLDDVVQTAWRALGGVRGLPAQRPLNASDFALLAGDRRGSIRQGCAPALLPAARRRLANRQAFGRGHSFLCRRHVPAAEKNFSSGDDLVEAVIFRLGRNFLVACRPLQSMSVSCMTENRISAA